MDGAADAQLDFAAAEFVENVLYIAQRSGQAVEFGNHQGVPRPAGSQRFPESWPGPVCTGEALVYERLPRCHPVSNQGVLPCGEVLVVGG